MTMALQQLQEKQKPKNKPVNTARNKDILFQTVGHYNPTINLGEKDI